MATSTGVFLDPAHRPFTDISIFDVNGMEIHSNASSALTVGCDIVQAGGSDPGCEHSLQNVNEGTYIGGQGNLLPQMQFGTNNPLWPWRHEERIKREMCQSVTRGFCGFEGTISEYTESF